MPAADTPIATRTSGRRFTATLGITPRRAARRRARRPRRRASASPTPGATWSRAADCPGPAGPNVTTAQVEDPARRTEARTGLRLRRSPSGIRDSVQKLQSTANEYCCTPLNHSVTEWLRVAMSRTGSHWFGATYPRLADEAARVARQGLKTSSIPSGGSWKTTRPDGRDRRSCLRTARETPDAQLEGEAANRSPKQKRSSWRLAPKPSRATCP